MKVGITGHQNLGSLETETWVRATLDRLIEDYRVTQGFTCLAVGTDQIYAEILARKEIPYVPVLPCRNYEKTFRNEEGLTHFNNLLTAARRIIWLDFDAPSQIAFFEAGKEVVERSEMIFAVWDGKEAKGFGGTADIVSYARLRGIPVIHIDTVYRHVVTCGERPVSLSLHDFAGSIRWRGRNLTLKGSGSASNIVVDVFLPK